jgi:hypothetical protein
LEIRKTVVPFDEQDVMKLERIITDGDEKEALRFIKKCGNCSVHVLSHNWHRKKVGGHTPIEDVPDVGL